MMERRRSRAINNVDAVQRLSQALLRLAPSRQSQLLCSLPRAQRLLTLCQQGHVRLARTGWHLPSYCTSIDDYNDHDNTFVLYRTIDDYNDHDDK